MLFRTIIENVFSGSGSDDAFGNDADNEIHAGAGDDLITGMQAMTHFWGNPITTRYLVKRVNPIYGALRFMCPTLPTLGPAAAPILFKCGTLAFTRAGSISDGTTATGRILGGIFGPNGENAGALLDASNPNTVEFRGDFVALRNP